MHVYACVYEDTFKLIAIFATRTLAEDYVRRTTKEGSRVFAHLTDFRVIEVSVVGSHTAENVRG